jgi:lysozyme
MNTVIDLIKRHEGLSLQLYKDSVGKTTIGYGRNIEDIGISQEEAEYLLQNDLSRAYNEVRKYDWFHSLSVARQAAVTDLMLNLGPKKFATFKRFIWAMDNSDWEAAENELKNSLWWSQVGMRGPEIVNLIRYEIWPQ